MFAKKQMKLFDPRMLEDVRKEALMSDKIEMALLPENVQETTLVYRRPELTIYADVRPRHLHTTRMEGRRDLEYVPDGEGFGVRFNNEVR
jgi:hypothetical protein